MRPRTDMKIKKAALSDHSSDLPGLVVDKAPSGQALNKNESSDVYSFSIMAKNYAYSDYDGRHNMGAELSI